MSTTSEHRRMKPVLDLARKLDIDNPAPEAIFGAGSAGFQIWCTPDDKPKGWEHVNLIAGAFAKPCGFVASVFWGWDVNDTITHLRLVTDAYDLGRAARRSTKVHNRPADIAWAKKKIRWLFKKAGVKCPPIQVVR